MKPGYIFVFSNPLHPDIIYFNYSHLHPFHILEKMNTNEGNVFDFKFEFAKWSYDYQTNGEIIENILNTHNTCVNYKKNFFVIEKSIVQSYFALCHGSWVEN